MDRTTTITFEPDEVHALLEFWRWASKTLDWPHDPALRRAFKKIEDEDIKQRQAGLRALRQELGEPGSK